MSGIKRHIVVDTLGLPHAVRVTTANVLGRHGAVEMLTIHREHFSLVRKYLVDGGYSGEKFCASGKRTLRD